MLTWVAHSRPRPGSIRTVGAPPATTDSRVRLAAVTSMASTSARLVGETQPLPRLRVARLVLPADQLDGARRATRRLRELRGGLGMVAEPRQRDAHARQPGHHERRPRDPRLPERVQD